MAGKSQIATSKLEGNRVQVAVLRNCARCQGTHRNLKFEPFTVPCGNHTHWRLCPKLREPILLEIVEEPSIANN